MFSNVSQIANKVKRLEFEEIDEQINRMQELKGKALICSTVDDIALFCKNKLGSVQEVF